MKAFDGRKGKRLPREIAGNLRFFAFYVGNETLLSGTELGVNYPVDIIFEPSEALGNIFALKLFRNYDSKGNVQENGDSIGTNLSATQLISNYIQSLNDNTKFPLSFERLQSPNKNNWRDVIVRFFKDLGLRNLQTEPLSNLSEDYAECLLYEGGTMERLTAIFCNVLRMDEEFNVMNEEWTRYRASQYIRLMNDDTDQYEAFPLFIYNI